MIAFLNSLPPLQAVAVLAFGPGTCAVGLAFCLYEAGRLVRLAITGRL
ncbi:hypothetical protein FHR71_000935 [Methylobacterium sp. RAS18]|nr:hypothetical protein [Methylorubrum extorquens]MBA9067205.1 hypothetical protein [Methylobacterium sp. RAS18]UYW25872.1 hypothetical protein OKC48_21775 [Methylorubrum extorquens]